MNGWIGVCSDEKGFGLIRTLGKLAEFIDAEDKQNIVSCCWLKGNLGRVCHSYALCFMN